MPIYFTTWLWGDLPWVSYVSATRHPLNGSLYAQNQVESATCGSEFMVAGQSVEQIIDLCCTLHMFGIPIDGVTILLQYYYK